MAATDSVQYDVTEGIATIRLNRPDVLNAFDNEMIEALIDRIQAAQDDDSVYVIVLTGTGRGFCSGADVGGMGENTPDRVTAALDLWRVQYVVELLYMGSTPSIAAINGPAIGAGADFTLACDLRVMSEDAYIREQFVNIGLVPGDGGGWLLPNLVGESKAKELILTGKDITPEIATDAGLVTDVVSDDELMEVARDLAESLRDKPAVSMQRTKDLVDPTQSFEEYARKAIEYQWDAMGDPEHAEAIAALTGGREPDYDRDY